MLEWEANIKIYTTEDRSLKIIIPEDIELVLNSISKKINTEFSIVGNIIQEKDDEILISPEWYIPEQEVTFSSVELKENTDHNVVFHTHPIGIRSFSYTDVNSINNNFMLSILYERGFVKASKRIKICEGKFLHILTDNIEISRPNIELNIDISKIKDRSIRYYPIGYKYSDYNCEYDNLEGGLYGYDKRDYK